MVERTIRRIAEIEGTENMRLVKHVGNARVEADSILSARQNAAIETDVESGHRPWTDASRRGTPGCGVKSTGAERTM
jgi:hypothetical protein